MHNITYNIFEPFFNKSSAYISKLSILIGDRFFRYLIEDENNRVACIREYKWDNQTFSISNVIRRIFAEDTFLRLQYKDVKISFFTPKSVLIPDNLYDEKEAEAYLTSSLEVFDTENFHTNHLLKLKVYNIFACDTTILSILQEYIPNSKYYHISTHFLLMCQRLAEFKNEKQLFVYIQQGQLQVIVFEGTRLLFCNFFHYQSADDFLYYIILSCRQTNFNTQKDIVYISGELMEDSDIYRLMYQYIYNIEFVKFPNFLQYGERVSQYPSHLFSDIFSLKLCE